MKTTEETIKAIEYRLDNLKETLDILLAANTGNTYFDYEARIDELETLLEHIKDDKTRS